MSKPLLNDKRRELLRSILTKRAAELLPLVDRIKKGELSKSERDRLLCDVLVPEFVQLGLREDHEPNEYGLQIDDLIRALPILGE